ncbi:LRR receptor-like serine/threonine-protein kinase ERECTA [Miscanthus floridulus]|uniref:LRR receptor-like serine/threonine-protein kinase ERECTA n=1 Tax=Miscanthus floridulus TaxID=154761 RepID=UPI003457D935
MSLVDNHILDPSGNTFSGAILGSLFTVSSALQELYISRNGFSGGVPPQLAVLGALTWLELQHRELHAAHIVLATAYKEARDDADGLHDGGHVKRLTGHGHGVGGIPRTLPSYRTTAGAAQTTRCHRAARWHRPRSAHCVDQPVVLDAYSNCFVGPLPHDLGELRRLQRLNLGGSFFNRSIPAKIGQLRSLWFLHLAGNALTKRLPSELDALA